MLPNVTMAAFCLCPRSLPGEAARIGKAIPLLLKHQLVEEAPIADRSRAWRDDDDQQAIGLFITGAGRALIAGDGGREADCQPAVDDEALLPVVASEVPPAVTKIEHVLVLLRGGRWGDDRRIDRGHWMAFPTQLAQH